MNIQANIQDNIQDEIYLIPYAYDKNAYKPPYSITTKMLDLCFSINQKIGMIFSTESLNKLPSLRKVNRVKTIYSSLSIENNIFTYEEVTKLINGYVIKGPKKDIDEIKNAYKAYEIIESIDPFKISDLLKVHKIMMKDLTVNYGKFRKGQVGVYNEKEMLYTLLLQVI